MPSSFRFGLPLIFIIFPLLEIMVLIKSGEMIGFWPTVLILMAAAVLGFFIIRHQGLSVLGRMVGAMNQGRLPLEPMLDSYVMTTAGFLLIMPGLISDAIGLLLLVPPLRHLAIRWSLGEFANRSQPGQPGGPQETMQETQRPRRETRRSSGPIVIEGTYERVEDDKDDNQGKP